ncbi:MAG: DUF6493 family protein, partial [Pseudomonadota bacterium]
MTPEQLEDLILTNGQPEEVQAAFWNMAEEDRKKLSTAAQKLHSQLSRGKANAGASERLKAATKKRGPNNWGAWDTTQTRRASLAVFACGPLSAVKKDRYHYDDAYRKAFAKIIEDRKPDWVDDWLAHELEQEWSLLRFETIRRWMKAGVCQKP